MIGHNVCRSQGGVEVPTGGKRHAPQARERLPLEGSADQVQIPEPTVKVRMEENGRAAALRWPFTCVIALGDVSAPKGDHMTHTRFAFVKANWHSEIVTKALEGFLELVSQENVDVFDVPGAFELPLMSRDLANSGKYAAVIAAALVVDGGIYRHDFVAAAVVNGLMRVGLDSGVPVLSVSLTPHQYQETEHHHGIFTTHFIEKGREAARAALKIVETRHRIAA
jgi:6,7-dimethyl-8-ribityllumazine synthase